MLFQVPETTRLARALADERMRIDPVDDFEPGLATVETRGVGFARAIVATRAAVAKASHSWKLFCLQCIYPLSSQI